MNSTAPGWVFAGSNYTPTLTSGNADTAGNGWLRLTDTGNDRATSAYYNSAFNAAGSTVYAKFDFESFGGSGADGIVFFLFDGSVPFSVGAYGGSIGYAQKTGINGMNGGYLGVALDEYGNYSAASEGRVGGLNGGSSLVPDSISVRGPGQGQDGYAYLGGTGTLSQSIDSASRPTQTNTVQILLSATNQLTVTLQQGGVSPQTVLQMDLSGYARPDTLKFGFASGTGGSTNYHDVRNLNVTTLASNLWSGNASNGLWASNTNWDPTVVPTVGADILFDNTFVGSAQTIDTGTGRSVRSISFDAPFNYTLNNNTLTFDSQGVAGFSGIAVTQTHGSAVQTINSALALNNAINIRNNTTGTLNLNGAIATNGNTVTLDGSGVNTNLSGVISGTGAVVKNDAGTDTLSGANTYSGGTTINAGALNANRSNALGTGGVTLAGGTLASTNSSAIANTIALTGSAVLKDITTSGTLTQTGGSFTLGMANATQSGNITLSNTSTNRTLTLQVDSGTSTVSGVIANGGGSSAGSVTKTGSGTLVLSGANTYTGTTTISGGSVQLGASDVLADGSSVSIGASGTLDLNNKSEKIGTFTAEGGATLDFGATSGANKFIFGTYVAPTSGVLVVNNWESSLDKLATTIASQNVSTIYISGYGVAQEAAATSAMGGSYGNAYLLTPVATAYKEWDGSSSSTWSTNNNWTSSGEPTSTQIALFNDLGIARPNVTLDSNYTIAGIRFGSNASVNYNITGSQTLTLAGTVPYLQQQSAQNQTLGMSGLALSTNTVADITGAGNLTISSAISGSGKNLIKDGTGAGKLILSGNNSGLTGGVFINNGTVQAANTNALGTGTTTIADGATLELSGGISPTNAIAVSGQGVGAAGAIRNVSDTNTLSGTITENGATAITADSGSTLNLTGNLTGTNTNTTFAGAGNINVAQITTGSGAVTINSTGTVTYNGGTTANTMTGTTTVTSGTLVLGKTSGTNALFGNLVINGGAVQWNADHQVVDTASVTVNNSATLNLNGKSETLGQLTSTSSTATVALGAGALTLSGANNTNSNYAGKFTGTSASSLNVNGSGKVYLSGNNSGFAGTTNVTNGTLNLSGSNSVLGTGAVNVSSAGNLQLQGGLTVANAVTINGTGTSGNGAIENFANNNTLSSTVTVAGNSRIQSDAGTLTLGDVALGSNTLTVGGNGNTTVTGVIGSGTGSLVKDGSGTLTLSGANQYTGTTFVTAGQVVAAAANTFASGSSLDISSGASLSLGSFSQSVAALNSAGSLSLLGASLALNSGASFLGGTLTGSGSIIVNAGSSLTLNADFNNANINIVLNGGTLNLNGHTDVLGNLSITGTSVIDFGTGSGSVLSINALSFGNTSLRLNVANWTDAQDYFLSQTQYTQGSAPLNQVLFQGGTPAWTTADSKWTPYDANHGQLNPVPEPSTYGAIFMGLCAVGVGYRRLRRKKSAA